jgi:hypothetical protein
VAPAAFDVLELDQGVEFAKKRGAWHAGGAGETAQRHRLAVRAPDEDARVPNLFGGLGTFGPFGISPLCTLSISPQDCLEMRFDGFAERPVPDCGDPAFAQLKSSD